MRNNNGLVSFVTLMAVFATASLSCNASRLPSLFATETPTSTQTFTPSPTPTVTPSPTPTSTPTYTPTATPRPMGVAAQSQSDGTSLFIDYDNQYQLILPKEWVIVPIKKQDLDKLVGELAKSNPNLVRSAEAFKGMDPDVIRMVALNGNPDYYVNNYVTNINITAVDNSALSAMPLSFVTGALEETFKQQGMKVLTTNVNVVDNSHGVDVEFIDVEQVLLGIRVQQRVLVFQTHQKLILITFSTLPQFQKEIFGVAEQIGASIELPE